MVQKFTMGTAIPAGIDNPQQKLQLRLPKPSLNETIPIHYTLYNENVRKDTGCTMYACLSRQLYGDPDQWSSVRSAVQLFALEARANFRNEYHHLYTSCEASYRKSTGVELFAALECPDLAPTEPFYRLITNALNIRLHVLDRKSPASQVYDSYSVVGDKYNTPCFLLCVKPEAGMQKGFGSLLPDESGAALVGYLLDVQEKMEREQYLVHSQRTHQGLALKRVSWAWDDDSKAFSDRSSPIFSCYNEFRSDSRLQDLTELPPSNRLDTFVAVVREPEHISPAVEIFKMALQFSRNQQHQVKVSDQCEHGITRPHCAMDVEFVRGPECRVQGKTSAEIGHLIRSGEVEELCSVLTLAVGRDLVIMFNMVEMLEKAKKNTVPALQIPFKEVVMKPSITKLMWNLQGDIRVLESTLRKMYSEPELDDALHGELRVSQYPGPWVFKSPHLLARRPDWLRFPNRNEECELHESALNEQGISCPCKIGIVDIAALLSHFCTLQGLEMPKPKWTEPRRGFNYGDLVESVLGCDRLAPILRYMKSCHKAGPGSVLDFYQSLGKPGMERNNNALAYNIGDVISLNMICELFFATDDARLVAKVLVNYHRGASEPPFVPTRSITQRQSNRGALRGIPLFEDNPRAFRHGTFMSEEYDELSWSFCTDASVFRTDTLDFLEHEERVALNRELLRRLNVDQEAAPNPVYESQHKENFDGMCERFQMMLYHLTNPLNFWVPKSCAKTFDKPRKHRSRVVRANQTHSEAFLQFLESPPGEEANPPPGFGAVAGSPLGLPAHVGRRPGENLHLFEQIMEAYRGDQPTKKRPRRAHHLPKEAQNLEPDHLVGTALAATNAWLPFPARVLQAKRKVQEIIDHEQGLNDSLGLPSVIDYTDLWDPEGREFRRMMKQAPSWMRRRLHVLPEAYENEEWMSVATLSRNALNEAFPDLRPLGGDLDGEIGQRIVTEDDDGGFRSELSEHALGQTHVALTEDEEWRKRLTRNNISFRRPEEPPSI